jgi:hypothetical protein
MNNPLKPFIKIILVGLIAGAVSEALLGTLFMMPFTQSILYNPGVQSQLYINITPTRNLPLSVGGLVVLSIIHAWLFTVLMHAIPGGTWVKKGLFWGVVIWLMYWVFQEWWIYHTLLLEPLILNLLELVLLLLGSLVEGLIIAFGFKKELSGNRYNITN